MNRNDLISAARARQLLAENLIPLAQKESSLKDSCGSILAEDVFAPANHPLFSQSAVDGFAIRYDDTASSNSLVIAGEVKAGEKPSLRVSAGKAVRIFTGAPVPEGADTVVMQEDAEWDEAHVKFHSQHFKRGGNIRPAGEQFKKNDTVLRKGTVLNPQAIGLLASLGIGRVKIYEPPEVKLLITGNEVVMTSENGKPGNLPEGRILESNGAMLRAALEANKISFSIDFVEDDAAQLAKAVANARKNYPLILITGGVSVGDYDFTPAALKQNGMKPIFHGVAQKPGKPLLFACQKNCAVFGLPGNPGAVLSCFYAYVMPYIRACMNAGSFQPSFFIPLTTDYRKPAGKTFFVAAKAGKNGVEILPWQQSYMLRSWAVADGIAELDEQAENFTKGQMVAMHFFK
ncbi:MAG TPA: molybdopterin molybdotransferase MoeA [Chitinophagales bacterium]|nr:molybdopterin molybdotransferase MoeA [Chitinophagales bacterium]